MDKRDIEIGKKIKQFRKGNMTQKELADKIGKTESSIRKYEKGLVTIPLDVLEQIADALGITPFDLMGWEYYDKQHSNEIKAIHNSFKFNEFLEENGYTVEENITKWHWEDDPSQKVQVPDEWEIVLSKDGYEATFTEKEFGDLQSSAKAFAIAVIEGKFFKKVAEQKNKPLPAATENGK